MRPLRVLLFCAALALATPSLAEEVIEADKLLRDPVTTFYLGSFRGHAASNQLSAPDNRWLLGMGINVALRDYTQWRPELLLLVVTREYATTIPPPAWSVIDDDMRLNTTILGGGVRRYMQFSPAVKGYGGGGLAYYHSTMSATGSTFGLPGTIEESDSTINLYLGAGIEIHSGGRIFSLEYRHMPFEGSFPTFNVHGAEIGGGLLYLGLGKQW